MARLIWSPQSADDLEAACKYIARDSPTYAADFARRVVDSVAALRRHPQLGRVVPELADPSLRELIVGHYRVLYDYREGNRVEILAVHHGARLLRADPREDR